MISKFKEFQARITWKRWLLFLILSQSIYIIMLTLTIPHIRQEAGGLQIFDMSSLGYTYDTAHLFLARLSGEGYRLYKFVQLPLDIFFPALNSLFGICTFALLKGFYDKAGNKQGKEKFGIYFAVMLFLPLCAMVADYLENIMILVMLTYKAAVPKLVVTIANIFTITKSMSTTVFYVTVVILLILIARQKLSSKGEKVNVHGEL